MSSHDLSCCFVTTYTCNTGNGKIGRETRPMKIHENSTQLFMSGDCQLDGEPTAEATRNAWLVAFGPWMSDGACPWRGRWSSGLGNEGVFQHFQPGPVWFLFFGVLKACCKRSFPTPWSCLIKWVAIFFAWPQHASTWQYHLVGQLSCKPTDHNALLFSPSWLQSQQSLLPRSYYDLILGSQGYGLPFGMNVAEWSGRYSYMFLKMLHRIEASSPQHFANGCVMMHNGS